MKTFHNKLWESYGFRDNPFDTTALSLQTAPSLPIKKAFVSRGATCETSRLMVNLLRSEGGNRFVLEGEVGVGKTSFVNYYKFLGEEETSFFTPVQEVSFNPQWRLKDFLLNILSLLTTKVLLLKGERATRKHPLFKDLLLLNKVTHTQSFEVEANLWGWGGGLGQHKQSTIPSPPEAQLFHYFQEAVSAIRKMGYPGILLHFENLELTSRESLEEAKTFFEEIRDSLQVRHVYYVFVAQPGFFQQVIAPLPRVRSIFFGWPVFLPPLSKIETLTAIHLRYKLLSIPGVNFIAPVENKFIEHLYEVYEGQIRFVMDAVQALVVYNPYLVPKTLNSEEARPLLQRIIEEKIRQLVSDKEWEILLYLTNFDRFTNSDISKNLGITPQNLNKYLQSLSLKGYIRFIEKRGRNAYYRITEDARLLKILAAPKISKKQEEKRIVRPEKKKDKTLSSLDSLNSRQQKLFQKNPQPFSINQYARWMDISSATASRDLKELEEKGLLVRAKRGRKVFYRIAAS